MPTDLCIGAYPGICTFDLVATHVSVISEETLVAMAMSRNQFISCFYKLMGKTTN